MTQQCVRRPPDCSQCYRENYCPCSHKNSKCVFCYDCGTSFDAKRKKFLAEEVVKEAMKK